MKTITSIDNIEATNKYSTIERELNAFILFLLLLLAETFSFIAPFKSTYIILKIISESERYFTKIASSELILF